MLKSAALFMAGALTVAGVGAAAPAVSQAAGHAIRHSPMARLVQGQIGRRMVLKSQLNVTAEQRQQIVAIYESHRAELASTAASMVEQKRALRDAVTSDDATDGDIRRAADKLGDTIGDASVIGRAIHRELQAVWTAEQRQLLDEYQGDKRGAVDTWLSEIAQP
jgi:Spy/CpxP family protein refolding chaperone